MRYRTLDPKLIIETAERLEERVAERFPDAGLRGVAGELVSLSRDLAKAAKALEAPIWWLRGVITAAVVAGALVFLFVGTILPLGRFSGPGDAVQSVQGIESSLNILILAVVGFLALMRAEERIKRKKVFRELHGLRSLIHVIDMHQLTKDPATLSANFKPTAHSPARITNAADLARHPLFDHNFALARAMNPERRLALRRLHDIERHHAGEHALGRKLGAQLVGVADAVLQADHDGVGAGMGRKKRSHLHGRAAFHSDENDIRVAQRHRRIVGDRKRLRIDAAVAAVEIADPKPVLAHGLDDAAAPQEIHLSPGERQAAADIAADAAGAGDGNGFFLPGHAIVPTWLATIRHDNHIVGGVIAHHVRP